MQLFRNTCVYLLVLCFAGPAFAQDREPAAWEPIGLAPVDQAGAGRRGYAMAGESAHVAPPHTGSLSLHIVAANNFYVEGTTALQISQRSETHMLAIEYRRGFKLRRGPRFEVGAQLQVGETGAGILNGFIAGFEDFVHASLRSRIATPPPLGTSVVRNGRPIYQSAGAGGGVGDLTVVAKALLRDRPAASRETRVAARLVLNVSGAPAFTNGTFVGAGLSVERKLFEWVALHGDARASLSIDRVSAWGLPLTRGVASFSVGPELRLAANSSLSLQYEGSTSPYQATGTVGLDSGYGHVAVGLNHRFSGPWRPFNAQLYARENMNLPFSVRWNTDPDFTVGLKITLR